MPLFGWHYFHLLSFLTWCVSVRWVGGLGFVLCVLRSIVPKTYRNVKSLSAWFAVRTAYASPRTHVGVFKFKIRLCERYFCLFRWNRNWCSGMCPMCVCASMLEFNRFSVKIYTTCHSLCHWITFWVVTGTHHFFGSLFRFPSCRNIRNDPHCTWMRGR